MMEHSLLKRALRSNPQVHQWAVGARWGARRFVRRIGLRAQVFFGRTVVVVYSIGRVGSTSVFRSLLATKLPDVYAIHTLDPNNPWMLDLAKKYDLPVESPGARRWQIENDLKNRVIAAGKPIKIITLVRDPVARNLSMLSLSLLNFPTDPRFDPRADKADLFSAFLKLFDHDTILEWFNEEVKRNLGIDVFSHKFPVDTGYSTINSGNISLLIIKNEIDDAIKEKAIKEFIALDKFNMIRSNISNDKFKKINFDYKEFKKYIIFPQEYIDNMYSSQYAKHFYSEEEIREFKSRWEIGGVTG